MLNSLARDSDRRIGPHQFTGKHMLWIMITFFGTVMLVNGALAYFAIESWTGLVVPNSYVASQSFNKDTEIRTQAVDNGAEVSVAIENGYIILHIAGKQKEALSASGLKGELRHPVDGRKEAVVEFQLSGRGTYQSLTPLPVGTWVGDISGDINGYGQWAEAVRFSVGG